MSGVAALCRHVRRYLPFWCAHLSYGGSSDLDECNADGRSLQVEWLGIVVNLSFGRRSDRAIAHNDAIFAAVIPARFNAAALAWETIL